MAEDTQEQAETPTQKLLREKRERDHAHEQVAKEKQIERTDLKDQPKQGDLPLPPENNVIHGRHVGREQTPSDLLKTDGSKSPHDVTSDGGSRQQHAINQVQAARDAAEALQEGERNRANQTGSVVTPTNEQRAQAEAYTQEHGSAVSQGTEPQR